MKWMTIAEAAAALSCSAKTIRRRIEAGEWETREEFVPTRTGSVKTIMVYLADGHSTDGHSTDGHSTDGHSTDGHSTDGQSQVDKSSDGHDESAIPERNPEQLPVIPESDEYIPELSPHIEKPPEYLRIGQLKAQVCRYVEEWLPSYPSRAKGWTEIASLYNAGAISEELLSITGRRSARTLQSWVKVWHDSGRDFAALAPDYLVGTTKRRTDVPPVVTRLIVRMLKHDNQIKIGSMLMHIERIATEQGLTLPSSRTLRRHVEDISTQFYPAISLARHGEKWFDEHVNKTVLRYWTQVKVGDIFITDGHVLNFLIINPYTGKPQRMCLVVFMDARSRMVLGGMIAPTENTRMISAALRNALLHYGGVPRVIMMDNGRAFKSQFFHGRKSDDYPDLEKELGGLYERLGIHVQFARAYNAKAKALLERWFGTMDDQFASWMTSYRGKSVSGKPAYLQRNEKFVRALHDRRPVDYQDAVAAMDTYIREIYGNNPHRGLNGYTPNMILRSDEPSRPIDAQTLNYLMLEERRCVVSNQGLRLPGAGLLYWHERLVGYREPVNVKYDWNDLRSVLVYDQKGRYLCTADVRRHVHPMINIAEDRQLEGEVLKQELREIAYVKKRAKESLKELERLTATDDDIPQLLPESSESSDHTLVGPNVIPFRPEHRPGESQPEDWEGLTEEQLQRMSEMNGTPAPAKDEDEVDIGI